MTLFLNTISCLCRSFSKLLAIMVLSLAPLGAWAAVCDPGDVQTCRLPNGCPGTRECYGAGYWTKCMPHSGVGATPCTGCGGASGRALCGEDGQVLACWVSDLEACNNCDDNGDGYVDNAPGSNGHYTLNRSCNRPTGAAQCSQSGSQVCVYGGWSACSGCGGTAPCTTACNVAGAIVCNASCELVSSVCTTAEACNDCDDDMDGVEDNGLSCQPCDL